ncbi:MAG: IPT/TIG domain-containing protein [Actinomycetes bacterium]
MAAIGGALPAHTMRLRLTAALGCLLVAVVMAIAGPAPARATILERLSIEQLSRRATTVAEGTVISTDVEQTPAGVRTAVRLRVRDSLKGMPSALKTVYVPGGRLPDGTQVVVDAMAAFRPGDACYVFVDARGWVMGGFQGKLDVAAGRVVGSGVTTATMSRRIEAALLPGRPAARPASAERLHPVTFPLSDGPTILSITPDEASAGTDTMVTIDGFGFGSARGKVEFSYGGDNIMRIRADDVSSWTDESIDCVVPTGVIARYDASAGTGPVVVTSSGGEESNAYDFVVPFGYGASRWANAGATYLVNPSGIDDALRESLVDAGADVWNAAGSGFWFTDGGITTLGEAKDGKNVISWSDDLPDGVIGQASSYENAAGDMTETDVQFSNAYDWADGAPGSGTMDVQSIAMHEIGHWLVLLDQYMDGDSDKVMYGFGDEGEQKRTLAPGDVAGITWIYPVDTVGPVCAAKNATVRHNGTVKLYFRVYDAQSAKVMKQLVIATPSGVVKQKWTWGYRESYDGWWSVPYTCRLTRGSYEILVTGKDLAGNSASKVGRATLTVK